MKRYKRLLLISTTITVFVMVSLLLSQKKTAWSSSLSQENISWPPTNFLQESSLRERRLDWERRKELIIVEDLKFENHTKGITVLSRERDGDFIKLKLRNDYTKIVTAYEVAIAKMTIHTECLTGADYDDLFLPGDIREESYLLQPDVDKLGVKLLAVVFDDGTADGHKKFIDEIRQYRLGMKMQREHSLALLKAIVNSDSVDIQSSLSDLEVQVPEISKKELEELPYFVRRGLIDEQNHFLRLIQRIKSIDDKTVKNKQTQIEGDLHDKKQILIKIVENYTGTLKQL